MNATDYFFGNNEVLGP